MQSAKGGKRQEKAPQKAAKQVKKVVKTGSKISLEGLKRSKEKANKKPRSLKNGQARDPAKNGLQKIHVGLNWCSVFSYRLAPPFFSSRNVRFI